MKKNIKALAFYCGMENPPDKKDYSDCIQWGKVHFQRAKTFENILHNGKCHNKFLGLSQGFIKCWDEAFDYARTINSDIKEAVYRAKFEDTYAHCMPMRIESMNQEELYQKHTECKKKAEKVATEFVNDIKPKIEQYLAKKQGG
ncbi:hypothetical protein [Thermocrinis albus]|nr:hypothetical protein [Thermocrinis albus]